ncbi:hypothetical protein [Azospirillum argentinense]
MQPHSTISVYAQRERSNYGSSFVYAWIKHFGHGVDGSAYI